MQRNTYEGGTILPIIKDLESKYGFSKHVVVVDSGLLSKSNIEELKKENYKSIIVVTTNS